MERGCSGDAVEIQMPEMSKTGESSRGSSSRRSESIRQRLVRSRVAGTQPWLDGTNDSRGKKSSARNDNKGGARRRNVRWLIVGACVGMVLLAAASMIGWAISYRAGVDSVESVGLQLQEVYPQRALFQVVTRMEPARVHLQQGLELLHQLGLDPTTWEAYEAIRKHGVSFLLNYFDDAQCCYGMFTHMSYTPGVNEDNFGDDRALFDAVIASKDINPLTGERKTSLFELRPGETGGSRTNPAYWVPFNMTTRRLPEKLEVTNYDKLGFLHLPRDDGVDPNNPESGWYNVIKNRNMQEGDFCFSPIFVWNVNKPVTLKIHGIMPVYAPAGANSSFSPVPAGPPLARERVGAYVVGFKLYFLSQHLENLNHKAGDIFLVERSTGYIIAANNVSMPLMSESQTVITAHEVESQSIRDISNAIAPGGNWRDVMPGHKDLMMVDGILSYIFVDEFKEYCLDWVVVVSAKRCVVLERIESYRTGTVLSSAAMPISLVLVCIIAAAVGYLLMFVMKNGKNWKKHGPPKQGDKVTLVTTDIQGSTTLWDSFPDKFARDIALHHQCLRGALKDHHGYEIATEGDSFKCAFHTAEDAVCWAIQVQFNLLCAPWSPELEDGGHSMLCNDLTWADTSLTMLPEHCEEIIWDLAKDAACFPADKAAGSPNKHEHVHNDASATEMFSPEDAALTPYSISQATMAPLATTHHFGGSRLPVFRGLRVRIGMHTGLATDVKVHESTKRMMYGGKVAEITKAVSDKPCGGQIIMTGETLADIESMHDLMIKVSNQCEAWCSSIGLSSGESAKLEFNEPAGLSVMHLGSHLLLKDLSSDGMAPNVYESGTSELSRASEDLGPHCASPILSAANLAEEEAGTHHVPSMPYSVSSEEGTEPAETRRRMREAQELVMIVPWPLRARALYYPPLPASKEVTPAWHSAPPAKGVTIVFTFIENWSSLKQWQEGVLGNARPLLPRALKELNLVVRALLNANHGYEVEGEDGSFVCAFSMPEAAMQFAVQVQDALLHVEWDEELLSIPWAAEQRGPDGALLFRGLRVAIGMCTGDAMRVQPSVRTGRQEYYGPIMNHAARLAVAAHGGQNLVHEDTVKAWKSAEDIKEPRGHLGEVPLYMVCFGQHKLKGVSKPIEISELSSPATSARAFPPIKAAKNLKLQDLDTRHVTDYAKAHREDDAVSVTSRSIWSTVMDPSEASMHMVTSSKYTLSSFTSGADSRPSLPYAHKTRSFHFGDRRRSL